MNALQKNQVCLVTGASRGIGRAIALEIGRHGAAVVGTATTQEGADAISRMLSEQGVSGRGAVLDVTEKGTTEQLVKATTAELGAPLILVNNAGITRDNLLLRMSEEDWDRIMETNLKSVYRLTKACLRGMTKARFGRVINITSVVGVSGNPGQTNYAAAKAGIIGFTKSLAQEVAGRSVTVNAIAPGFIETDMTRSLTPEQREQLIGRIPAGRLGTPEDVAKAAAFLASADAAYLTGVTLHVNGGMYMV
ncbi:MAG: 3-oxoacyl-ACP reductase FabG [Gammaproteobacteria bacterium]|nr:3-oxoacyl-ACP reductase FabG [Gammaproteobacteria bacterium]